MSQPDEPYVQIPILPPIRARDVMRHHECLTAGILISKGFHIRRIEVGCRPFALDRDRLLSMLCPHEIDFVSPLVAPVADVPGLQMRMQFVQDEMLPEKTAIVSAEIRPATIVRDEACIKRVHLRRSKISAARCVLNGRSTCATNVASRTAR